MAKTLEEIFSDTQNYPDNLTIKFNDTDIPLGSLRNANKSQRDALNAELTSTKEARRKADDQVANASKLAEQAAKLNADLEARLAADPRGTPTADQFDTDPWYEPIRKRLAKYDEAVTKFNQAVESLTGMQKNMSMTWFQDRMDSQFAGLKMSDKNRKSQDELLKYAADNKIVDKFGVPSLILAWDKMTETDRLAEASEKARLEGIEQGKREAFVGRVRPPSSVAPGSPPPQFTDWNQLTDTALADPEIRRIIEQSNIGVS